MMLQGIPFSRFDRLAVPIFFSLGRYVAPLGGACQFAPDRQKCFKLARFKIGGALLHEGVYDRVHGMVKGCSRIGKRQSKRTSIARHTLTNEQSVAHQFIEFEGNCTGQNVEIFGELARAVDPGMDQADDIERSSGAVRSFPQFLQGAAEICLQCRCKSYDFEQGFEALRFGSGHIRRFCVTHDKSFGIRNEVDPACI